MALNHQDAQLELLERVGTQQEWDADHDEHCCSRCEKNLSVVTVVVVVEEEEKEEEEEEGRREPGSPCFAVCRH